MSQNFIYMSLHESQWSDAYNNFLRIPKSAFEQHISSLMRWQAPIYHRRWWKTFSLDFQ